MIVQFQKNIHIPHTEGFLFCTPPPPPGNSSLAPYFASKILAFKTPLPLGISDDLPWGGYGFFSGNVHYKGLKTWTGFATGMECCCIFITEHITSTVGIFTEMINSCFLDTLLSQTPHYYGQKFESKWTRITKITVAMRDFHYYGHPNVAAFL